MPRLIDPASDPGIGSAIDLAALIDGIESADWDARDEESLVALGPLLARLGQHPRFLTDLAIAELERRFAGQEAAGYGAQVLMLAPPRERFALRANFWPARHDAVVRTSGTAPFFYDLAHDHNFSFLTFGYRGPGYWSDYYELDAAPLGLVDERANLRFVERARLEPGRLMLYRAHRDVHLQLPPDAFSVSLNILFYDLAQPWRSQYRFDVARDTIAEALTTTGSEALVTLAAQFGGDGGRGLAQEMARRHPVARMRATALDALAAATDDAAAVAALYARAADDVDPHVAGVARRRLADCCRNG